MGTETPRRRIRARYAKVFLGCVSYIAAGSIVTYFLLGAGAAVGIAIVNTISLSYLTVLSLP